MSEHQRAADQAVRKANILDNIEPLAAEFQKNYATVDTVVGVSMAISLKRIADALDPNANQHVGTSIFTAISQAMAEDRMYRS